MRAGECPASAAPGRPGPARLGGTARPIRGAQRVAVMRGAVDAGGLLRARLVPGCRPRATARDLDLAVLGAHGDARGAARLAHARGNALTIARWPRRSLSARAALLSERRRTGVQSDPEDPDACSSMTLTAATRRYDPLRFDGSETEVDLIVAHSTELRKSLEKYAPQARKAGGTTRHAPRGASRRAASPVDSIAVRTRPGNRASTSRNAGGLPRASSPSTRQPPGGKAGMALRSCAKLPGDRRRRTGRLLRPGVERRNWGAVGDG